METLNDILQKVKIASTKIAILSTEQKNQAIVNIANNIVKNSKSIIDANIVDVRKAEAKGISKVMIDRLKLTKDKIKSISADMIKISKLDDPVGEIIETYNHPNNMTINKVRVPFGVICAIYESRPNVSVDIACLCIKTGNACVLKGGSEAINTNVAIVNIIQDSIKDIVDKNAVTLIKSTDRTVVSELIQAKEYIDLVVPRGGKNLINFVVSNSKVPFIETGAGNCHLYVNEDADFEMALKICVNAKVSKPSVCNAIETILVDKKIANEFLPKLKEELDKYQVIIKGCNESVKILKNIETATEEDYYQEYNDLIVTLIIVNDVNEAISHINKYGTNHSETIVTNNMKTAEQFLNEISSACVYVNASTRFSDGGEFGFGAELGISTQKLHARGPMGLKEMTTYKYKIYGEGQVR